MRYQCVYVEIFSGVTGQRIPIVRNIPRVKVGIIYSLCRIIPGYNPGYTLACYTGITSQFPHRGGSSISFTNLAIMEPILVSLCSLYSTAMMYERRIVCSIIVTKVLLGDGSPRLGGGSHS